MVLNISAGINYDKYVITSYTTSSCTYCNVLQENAASKL